jgi:prepilin-type N-terminal cleavage/methylation domain-containing protein
MIRRRHNGLTLIELLIVIAIMAIMSAASLAVIVAPAREHAYATIEMQFEAGAAAFFAAITNDLHSARDVTVTGEPAAIVLGDISADGRGAAYWVDAAGNLRRAVLTAEECLATRGSVAGVLAGARGAVLLGNVIALSAEREGDAWRIAFRAKAFDVGRTIEASHELKLLPAIAWAGGTR